MESGRDEGTLRGYLGNMRTGLGVSPDLLVVVSPVVVGAGGPVVAIGQTVPVAVSAPVAGASTVSLPARRTARHCILYYNTALPQYYSVLYCYTSVSYTCSWCL